MTDNTLEAAMEWAEGLDSTMMTARRLAFVKALAGDKS